MNIELAITGITPANRREKLIKAAHALSDLMGLGAEIERPVLEKAQTHKYISKKWVNDHWEYFYPQTNNERRANSASQIKDIMSGIQPLNITPQNVSRMIQSFKNDFMQSVQSGLYVKHLQNRKIVGITDNHLTEKHGKMRPFRDIENHVKYLPFVIPLIQKYGHVSHTGVMPDGRRYYELTGKAVIGGKKYAVSIILSDDDNNKVNLVCVSSFGFANKMVKAIGGVWHDTPALSVPAHAGGRLGRGGAFPSPVSNNLKPSDQSSVLPQSQKRQSRPATVVTNNIIPQIWAKSIAAYPDLKVFIQNITPQNRKAKFAKAIRAAAGRLGVPVSIERHGNVKPNHAGEPYLYPIQQELSDYWSGYYQDILKTIYDTVIAAL
ncbi:MAG: hypothetical protein LBD55_06270, partial [Treponema sp.]|nr:hypothetical protein [Treponema sp.]